MIPYKLPTFAAEKERKNGKRRTIKGAMEWIS
jgi:hypothetical protein